MPRKGEQLKMWQRVLSPDIGDIDPEHEKELRLVAQARAGAAWALSALVARYQPPVVRYLVRLTGSAERGRALAEVVLVRMAKRVRGPHGGDHLRLWLLRTATEVGLDALRHPQRSDPRRLAEPSGPVALIAGRVGETPVGRWVAGWGTRMRAQAEPREPVRNQQFIWQTSAETPAMEGEEHDQLTAREALKYRMVRAVLAELPYGDAQCLSLHLVAGLNQTEVAQALGIAPAVARRRIVQGLQLFGRRYDAALAGLGLSSDFEPMGQDAAAPAAMLSAGAMNPDATAAPPASALDAPGVVDAATMAQPAPPPTLPIVRLAQPSPALAAAEPGSSVAASTPHVGEAEEARDAEERALTSAAIMAYLRTAAANARSRDQVRAVVEADPISVPPVGDHAEVTAHDEEDHVVTGHPVTAVVEPPDHDDTSGVAVPDVVATDSVPDGVGGVNADGKDHPGEQLTLEHPAPAVASSDEETSAIADEIAGEMTDTEPMREPRLVPVLDPVEAQNDDVEPSEPNLAELDADHDSVVHQSADATPAAVLDLADVDAVASMTLALPPSGEDTDAGSSALDMADAGADPEVAIAWAASSDPGGATDGVEEDDHVVLVVEPDPEPPPDDARLRLLRARRTHVLSADGEAEDPSDAEIWPVS